MITPEASPNTFVAAGPSHNLSAIPLNGNHHSYHLTLIPGVGIAVTVVAVIMLVVLVFLIRRKSRELEDCENIDKTSSKTFPPRPVRKFQEGMVVFFLTLAFLLPICM